MEQMESKSLTDFGSVHLFVLGSDEHSGDSDELDLNSLKINLHQQFFESVNSTTILNVLT